MVAVADSANPADPLVAGFRITGRQVKVGPLFVVGNGKGVQDLLGTGQGLVGFHRGSRKKYGPPRHNVTMDRSAARVARAVIVIVIVIVIRIVAVVVVVVVVCLVVVSVCLVVVAAAAADADTGTFAGTTFASRLAGFLGSFAVVSIRIGFGVSPSTRAALAPGSRRAFRTLAAGSSLGRGGIRR